MRSIFSFLIATFLTQFSSVCAVEVHPARLEMTVAVTEPTQGRFEISNHSAKTVQVKIQAAPYRFLQEKISLPSAQGWFSFEPAEFSLGANSSTTVSYTITPPSNVVQDAAGEYVAAILVDELPTQDDATKGPSLAHVTIVPRFAVPVYVKIKGRELIQLEITNLRVRAIPGSDQCEIETTLQNRGTVHVRPSGTVSLLNARGDLIRSSQLGKAFPVLPTALLAIPTFVLLPPPGLYKAVVVVEPVPGQLIQKESSFEVMSDHRIRTS